ncbi:MAG TPA: GAF domain-containing protein [Methylomirabilota bacterium]|nr:GAF domain-containing protein [Methylomirabilota bacterium]
MNDEFAQRDLDPPVLRTTLSELRQALDSLSEHLSRLERAGGSGAGAADRRTVDSDDNTLALFQEILSIPSAGLEPGELYALAVDRVARMLAADRTMLFVVEAPSGRLVPRSARGFRRDDLLTVSLLPGEGLVGRVFAEKRMMTFDSAASLDEADPFIERFPVREAIAVPVRADGEVAGVLYAGRRTLGAPFSVSDTVLLLVLADRVGAGLVHQRLLERHGSNLAHLRELGGFVEEAAIGRALTDALARACDVGCRLVGARAAAVALLAGDWLTLSAACGLPDADATTWRVNAGEGLTGEMLAGQAPVACRDVQTCRSLEDSFLGDAGFHACLLVPLRLGGRTLGALYLADTEIKDFSPEEIEAAQVLASLVAAAVENNRVHGELRGALDRALAAQEGLVQGEKARALGEMASGISREFNNIFAIILGKAQLLLARAHDDSLREGLGMLEEAAWRGADIVHRLLGLAATTTSDTVSPVEMTALIQDAVGLTQTRWDEPAGRGQRIEMVTDLQPVPSVAANPTALRAVVMNLIVNAVDAMPAGGRIVIRTRPRAEGVELRMSDTGEGIADEIRSRIFDAFFTTRAPQRLGLGLSVAHAIVTRYRGAINIKSAAGGTTVTVWLPSAGPTAEVPPPEVERLSGLPRDPVAGSAPEAPPKSFEPPKAPPPTEAGLEPPDIVFPSPEIEFEKAQAVREGPEPGVKEPAAAKTVPAPVPVGEPPPLASILIFEEEVQIRSMLVDALTEAGYRVEAAADGPEGLTKLGSGGFDLVLTDLSLPDRSGLQVAQSVKRLSQQTAVVLVTGWGHLLDHDRLRESGVDLILVKPFRLDRVLSVVRDALRLRTPA